MSISPYGVGHDDGHLAEGAAAGSAVRPFHTIRETGEVLRVSRATVYRLISNGDLELVKLGSKALVTGRSLERVIARLLGEVTQLP